MSVSDIARVYASSLIDIGREKNILPDIEEETKFLADLFTEDDEIRQFFTWKSQMAITPAQQIFPGKSN